MALIKCPECGREISSAAAACIHCGFPIANQTFQNAAPARLPHYCYINGVKYDFSDIDEDVTDFFKDNSNPDIDKERFVQFLKGKIIPITGINSYAAGILAREIYQDRSVPREFDASKYPEPRPYDPSVLRCPKCGSTAVTTGARGVNWTWGLIGAGKTVNRCGKCGHTWTPKK